MQSATSTATMKRSKQKSHDMGQFDLFAAVPAPLQSAVEACPKLAESNLALTEVTRGVMQPDPALSSMTPRELKMAAALSPAKTQRPSRRKPVDIYIVTESDLPDYSDDEKAIVDRTLEALPQSKAWFTYADIKQAFTISRATVVRRVRSGVVPGIRFAGDRVLEDGSIRRFTREQVRYLLLAIRRR